MSIVYYIITLIFLVLVIEIISMIFKATGLGIKKARFQVISILTHTGFTTRESELISQHPLRRRIASYLMLASYVAQAGLISIFTKILIEKENISELFIIIFILVLSFVILSKNRSILSKIDKFLEKYLSKKIKNYTKKRTVDEVLKLDTGYGVYEIVLEEKNELCNKSIKDAKLKDRYIQILNIDKGSHVIEFPNADHILSPADKLIVYGKIESITKFMLDQKD